MWYTCYIVWFAFHTGSQLVFTLLVIHRHLCLIFDQYFHWLFHYLISYDLKQNTCEQKFRFGMNSFVWLFVLINRTLSTSIYQSLTNLFALFQRQVRMDVDVLQNLIRWILNDTTIRARTRIPVAYPSKPDHKLCRAAINCKSMDNFLFAFSSLVFD